MALVNKSLPTYLISGTRRIISLPTELDREQIRRINQLLGWALLDDDIYQRLVVDRDPGVMTGHGLSDEVQIWLRGLPAQTLQELAEQVLEGIELARGPVMLSH